MVLATASKGWTNQGFRDLPSALVIKETISALLKLLCDGLGLLVSLEPCLVLLVEAPTLTFEGLGRQVLLVGSLLVVEGVEQAVGVDPAVKPGVVEDAKRLLRVVRRGVSVRRLWLVVIGLFGVQRDRAVHS